GLAFRSWSARSWTPGQATSLTIPTVSDTVGLPYFGTSEGAALDLHLTGRRAIVTGASKGIGRAVALALAEEGVALALCARDGGPLADVAREVESRGVPVYAAKADVTSESDVARFVKDAAAALGGIDILVNNAGGAIPGDFFSLTDE